MCGKDGAQRRVYKLKEEHERRGDRNRKRKKRKRDVNKKEESEKREKELRESLEKNLHCTNFKTLNVLESESFEE